MAGCVVSQLLSCMFDDPWPQRDQLFLFKLDVNPLWWTPSRPVYMSYSILIQIWSKSSLDTRRSHPAAWQRSRALINTWRSMSSRAHVRLACRWCAHHRTSIKQHEFLSSWWFASSNRKIWPKMMGVYWGSPHHRTSTCNPENDMLPIRTDKHIS